MTPPVKSFPSEALGLASAQQFQKTCQQKFPEFDLSQVHIANRNLGTGDGGVFQLLYTEPEGDKFCAAEIHWPTHEMEVRYGSHQSKKITERWFFGMQDACSFTQKTVGAEEFDGQVCKDEAIDARMVGADQFKSVQYFREMCQGQLTRAYRKAGHADTPPELDLGRVQILNPSVGDGNYSLMYQNLGVDFFCKADIDTTAHSLLLSHGPLKEADNGNYSEHLQIPLMTDDCSMTRTLLGDKELVNPLCKDHSESEQKKDRTLGVAWSLTTSGMFYYFIGNLGKKIGTRVVWNPLAAALGPRLTPFLDSAGIWAADALPALATKVSPRLGEWTGTWLSRSATTTAAEGLTVGRLVKGGLVATVLVYGFDKVFEAGVVGDAYQASVNKRVTQLIYGRNVSAGWNLANPISWVRLGARAISPNSMEWATAADNPALVEKMIQKDKEDSDQAEAFLLDVLPPLLRKENGVDPEETAKLLRQPIILSPQENLRATLLRESGVAILKTKFGMGDEAIEALSQRVMLHEAQQAARLLVYLKRTQNDWARDLFNADGSLKTDRGVKNLQEAFPYDRRVQVAANP